MTREKEKKNEKIRKLLIPSGRRSEGGEGEGEGVAASSREMEKQGKLGEKSAKTETVRSGARDTVAVARRKKEKKRKRERERERERKG